MLFYQNDIRVIELSKELGVTPFIVSVPNVCECSGLPLRAYVLLFVRLCLQTGCLDGVGTGQWRKLSVQIPALVRASIKLRIVHRFDKEAVSRSMGTHHSVHLLDQSKSSHHHAILTSLSPKPRVSRPPTWKTWRNFTP